MREQTGPGRGKRKLRLTAAALVASAAHDLYVHLVEEKARRITNPKNAQPGDVIFANWKARVPWASATGALSPRCRRGFR